jgi:hypothetical protein
VAAAAAAAVVGPHPVEPAVPGHRSSCLPCPRATSSVCLRRVACFSDLQRCRLDRQSYTRKHAKCGQANGKQCAGRCAADECGCVVRLHLSTFMTDFFVPSKADKTASVSHSCRNHPLHIAPPLTYRARTPTKAFIKTEAPSMKLTSLAAVALLAALCTAGASVASAADPYIVEMDVVLSKKKGKKPKGGVVRIEVHPDWAPVGAARFKEIIDAGIWEWNRFFRCVRSRALDPIVACIYLFSDFAKLSCVVRVSTSLNSSLPLRSLRTHRVVPDFIVQWGIPSDKKLTDLWWGGAVQV